MKNYNKTKVSINDIDNIVVLNGPGSFTGIRVGVTVAKTIAWALKKDIIPLSSLELMATTNTNKKYLIPMIDARRGNVFGAIYDKDLNIILKEQLISREELLKNKEAKYLLVSNDFNVLGVYKFNKVNLDIVVDSDKSLGAVSGHKVVVRLLNKIDKITNYPGFKEISGSGIVFSDKAIREMKRHDVIPYAVYYDDLTSLDTVLSKISDDTYLPISLDTSNVRTINSIPNFWNC